ncbi:MAG TPA: FAD-dependent oxidoreductase [Macromonas sp.]|nr:FAD-dependent oxidoreductase [Macromonas sp.]
MSRLPPRSAPPVLILGAGLMGRLLAVSLARAGHAVRIVDGGPPDGSAAAAHVAAAMLAPLAESAVTEPNVVMMGQYAVPRWQEIIATLEHPVFFQQAGTLVLWHRQDAPQAQRFRALLAATCQAVPSLPAPQALDSHSLAEREPAVAERFQQGLYLPDEGQLDNRQLLQALLNALHSLGVAVEWNSPWTLEQAQAHQRQHGGWVLDCRGLGAKAEWKDPQSSLRGVRGEVVRLHAPDVTLQRPTRLLHPRYPIYIAPKENHIFVIGATEIETDDLSPVSVRSAMELLSAAYTVHPGFGEARILELCSQCRPTLPDNLPAVHEVAPQVLQINGLYRHGFMIAPAVHDAVLEHLLHNQHTLAQRLNLRFDTLGAEAPAC